MKNLIIMCNALFRQLKKVGVNQGITCFDVFAQVWQYTLIVFC